MRKNKLLFIMFVFSLLLVVIGCQDESRSQAEREQSGEEITDQRTKTELKVAINSQPTTLDQHLTHITATRDTGRLIFETLLTINGKHQAEPMLAESVEQSEDGKTYTFHLRQGIKFHNGKEMVAEDVTASMERWLEKSPVTGSVFDDAVFKAEDDYTVVLELAHPSALVMDILASPKQAPAIMPKEVIEAETEEGLDEYIGTGPYQFVEWKQDQYLHFTKFEDYQSLDQEADGLSGKKEALVDDIYFYIVTDPSTRLAGIETGEYDIIYQIPFDDYERISSNDDLNVVVDSVGELIFLFNKAEGIASDFNMREAINTALNVEEIMEATYSSSDFYRLSAGYMNPDISNWASDAGAEYYNINDPERAKELLEEMNYDGEVFRIMATRDYPEYYNAAVVIQEQLTQIGLNVELEVFDWATFNEKVEYPEAWDSLIVGVSLVSTPIQLVQINPTFAGGVGDDKIIDLLDQIELAATQEEAKQLWDELQGHAWENHLPLSMLGSYNNIFVSSKEVEGFDLFSGPVLWNTKLND